RNLRCCCHAVLRPRWRSVAFPSARSLPAIDRSRAGAEQALPLAPRYDRRAGGRALLELLSAEGWWLRRSIFRLGLLARRRWHRRSRLYDCAALVSGSSQYSRAVVA